MYGFVACLWKPRLSRPRAEAGELDSSSNDNIGTIIDTVTITISITIIH